MLADSTIQSSSGNLSSGIEPNGSIKAVVAFIKTRFKLFAERNKGAISLNEKGLTQKLCIFLNQHAKEQPFFFHSEFMENVLLGSSAQVDIGTISYPEEITIKGRDYNDDDSFFSIEAKRLPTPGQNRKREYVIGHEVPSGGMERFKKGIHGGRLKYAALIGYVQQETFNHWFLTINSWIDGLVKNNTEGIWFDSDKIEWLENNDHVCVELFSENIRVVEGRENDIVSIYHFWINLL